MTISMHWWSPARSVRASASEARDHGQAWFRMAARNRGRISNFGDAVNPLVIKELTNRPVIWRSLKDANLVSIGSVLDGYMRHNATATVFGSGLRTGVVPAGTNIGEDKVISVRGSLTRSKLGLPDTLPIGDPGLVIRALISRPKSPRLSKVLIPHFTELNGRRGNALLREAARAGFEIVLPNEHPLDVARKIADGQVLLTSSLHGVVFADALGTPAQLVNFSASKTEPEFKFRDYMSAFNLSPEFAYLPDLLQASPGELVGRLEQRSSVVRDRADDAVEAIFRAASGLTRL